MKLLLIRKIKDDQTTIGDLFTDGSFECHTLEDKDRGLTQTMTHAEVAAVKVYGKTAIPSGTYEVVISWSEKHKRMLPHLLDVPGYGEIEMHIGNFAVDTLGCILLGVTAGKDFIGSSAIAFNKFYAKLLTAIKTEKVFITIQ
jgi:hypothetical protein